MNLIISGTNRVGSHSLKVASYYQQELSRKGEEWGLLSLGDLPENIIVSDLYNNRSEAFSVIQEQVSAAKKFIFIIPEYNGSYPGVLKVFIDACTFPVSFFNKKVALVGVSSGKYGNIRGVDHFTGVCNYLRMHVLPLKIHIPHIQSELNEDQQLFQSTTVKFVQEQIHEIIQF
ncbi:NADPH-dependent FMN reductase [Sphingobacterium spiritivorum]|uniref:Flavin reductase n=1 Tax=Sphingobacterium spiritivorum ATCC 33861 TaxID=525373 RepID=D7VLC6_SPHSI|nr:NAD(P)H-dependent oxidoreductase [Sphingobacterium spiritivorum]EFK58399.1 flavin reductase [Sphingobacterium spiritivorum ATCC 33861]QQT37145.1 NAD(P)H-dependent oxidoreductase [Sphingobacterium spiritivorum]WQD33919.1 NAD(P)H-dependent oxidoreductase [Sphingobacterium spiritivorum]SUJ28154.1 Predicted flavoprotein [Sphingobacterium spiritivorum]